MRTEEEEIYWYSLSVFFQQVRRSVANEERHNAVAGDVDEYDGILFSVFCFSSRDLLCVCHRYATFARKRGLGRRQIIEYLIAVCSITLSPLA